MFDSFVFRYLSWKSIIKEPQWKNLARKCKFWLYHRVKYVFKYNTPATNIFSVVIRCQILFRGIIHSNKNERFLLGTSVYVDKLTGQLTSTQEFWKNSRVKLGNHWPKNVQTVIINNYIIREIENSLIRFFIHSKDAKNTLEAYGDSITNLFASRWHSRNLARTHHSNSISQISICISIPGSKTIYLTKVRCFSI